MERVKVRLLLRASGNNWRTKSVEIQVFLTGLRLAHELEDSTASKPVPETRESRLAIPT